MKHKVFVSDDIEAELDSACQWYRQQAQSADVANQWLSGIQDAIESLSSNPHRCSIAHEDGHFPYELRELLYGSGRRKTHRVLFRIVGDRVEVMAIRHVAQRDLSPDDL